MARWNDLIILWTKCWSPFCSLCSRSRKPPQYFLSFKLLYRHQPFGVLDVLREVWEEGPSESKNEIQHVLDLRTKLHTLGQLSIDNLLQAQDKQSRLHNRATRLRNFALLHFWEIKYLYYSPLLALNYLPSGKGPSRSYGVQEISIMSNLKGQERGTSNLPPQPPKKVERGGTGDAGDSSEWRGRSRDGSEH